MLVENPYESSNSRMQAFLRCRFLYRYRHVLQLVPRIEFPHLRRGTLIHGGMAAGLYAQHGGLDMPEAIASRIKDMWSEWTTTPQIASVLETEEGQATWDESVDMREDCVAIVLRAFDRLGIFAGEWETLELDGTPLIEYKLTHRVVLPDGTVVDLSGTLDWAARHRGSGHSWLIDWKSRKGLITDAEYDDANMQAGMYQHLLAERGLILNGTSTGQIKASVPAVPKVNTGKGKYQGCMSRAPKSTDWETYRDAVEAAGLDPSDYQDVHDKLKPFQLMTPNYRSPKEVAAMFENSMAVLADMVTCKREEQFYRSMSPANCRGCEVRELCLEGMRGGDIDELQRTLFMHVSEQPASWAYNPPEVSDDADTQGE